MKEIKLTQGKVALVGDADYEALNSYKWFAMKCSDLFYAGRTISKGGRNIILLMHREILKAPKGIKVDHRDGNGLNNKRNNIRLATDTQNSTNRKKKPKFSSKYLGVSWVTNDRKWIATSKLNYKSHYCGKFDSEIEAALAYNEMAKKLHGDFAKLNIIE